MSKAVQIIILSLPFIIEAIVEAWFEKKKAISVNHFWTAAARGVLMLLIAGLFNLYGISTWWQAFLFSVVLHGAFFNYFYNALTGRPWYYLRSEGIDKLISGFPPLLWAGWMALILVSMYMVYFHLPVVLGHERPEWLYPY